MLKDVFARRVERGAALLDRVNPEWFRQVNVSCLNIKSNEWCVLGQVCGTYTKGLIETGLGNNSNAVTYGFFIHLRSTALGSFLKKILLERNWKKMIRSRLSATPFVGVL